jgi:anti-sigma-K factor RskA
MTDHDEIDALAAEYALGTLDAADRAMVAARRQREAELSAAIEAWERRLGPLAETVPPVTPPANLFDRIEERISTAGSQNQQAQRIVELERYARRWRGAAIAASALAASLLLVIGVRELVQPPQPSKQYVAAFQKDDASPLFLLSVDLETRTLSIRSVAAQPQAGKSYQLWIASDQIGPAPQSLGLIEDSSDVTRRALARYDRAIVEKATFGVSLEPLGGSPTGRPTGPALHAKLIATPQ